MRMTRSGPTIAGWRLVAVAAAAAAAVLSMLAWPGQPSAAAEPTARAAAVRDCNVYAYYPNVRISSARNMTCRRARRDFRRYGKPIGRRFRTPGGFRCRQVSGSRYGGQWRCVNGGRAYRFEFGD